jgi:hypothetical protein
MVQDRIERLSILLDAIAATERAQRRLFRQAKRPPWAVEQFSGGGGKDPDFQRAFEDGEGKVIGDEPYNTGKDPDPSEKAVS